MASSMVWLHGLGVQSRVFAVFVGLAGLTTFLALIRTDFQPSQSFAAHRGITAWEQRTALGTSASLGSIRLQRGSEGFGTNLQPALASANDPFRRTSRLDWSSPSPANWTAALFGTILLVAGAASVRRWRTAQERALALDAEEWISLGTAGETVSRRSFGAAAMTSVLLVSPAAVAFPPTEEADPIPASRYVKLPSGVIYADAQTGTGKEAEAGDRASIQWVLRRSNGYFVDSSNVTGGNPFQFTIGDPAGAIAGLDEGIRGMKMGGVRRILIPPRLGYVSGVDDGKPGPVPVGFGPRQQVRRIQEVRRDVPGEYIFLEVELTRLYTAP